LNDRPRHGEAREAIVQVRGLHTRFGDRVVHEDISLDIYAGEVTAIVGGSGSGKSTLMREIVMLQDPTEGSVKLLGQEVTELGDVQSLPLRKRIGVMFQYGALFGDQTILENVGVPLREHTSLSDRLIDEVGLMKLDMVGLDAGVAPLYPSQLSGGMRKRASMARAIALDPELIFLDEPSSGLDPVSADALDNLIIRMRELLGLTVVTITHDMDSLWRVADRVVLLGRRRVLAVGSMEELMASTDPDVQEFFQGPRGRLSASAHTKEHRP
jgi:phospholipid/cholesterol/gamma-HCH transport system ATP-binding protein